MAETHGDLFIENFVDCLHKRFGDYKNQIAKLQARAEKAEAENERMKVIIDVLNSNVDDLWNAGNALSYCLELGKCDCSKSIRHWLETQESINKEREKNGN